MAILVENRSTLVPAISLGNLSARLFKVTFDSSYPTAGEAFTAALCGLSEIVAVIPIPRASTTTFSGTAHVVSFNPSTNKLQAFDFAGVEVVNATDLSALIFDVLVLGF